MAVGSAITIIHGPDPFLPEDIAIRILVRLPSGSAIARCRCVCRSWRNLLSDHNFLGKIISFKTPDVQKSLQILLTGRIRESYLQSGLLSYETLDPIPPSGNLDSPSKVSIGHFDVVSSKIVGCCNGIVCILVHSRKIILWNPATSEAKTLPSHCPVHPDSEHEPCGLAYLDEHVGLGFDPLTEDYKVVQVLENRGHGSSPGIVYTKVYSVRNGSWKTVSVSSNPFQGRSALQSVYVHQQPDTSRDEKCYWISLEKGFSIFSDEKERKRLRGAPCEVISFDFTTEEFSSVPVPQPGGLGGRNSWFIESCFMSKGMLVATFVRDDDYFVQVRAYKETWALLKCGVGESWIKLFTFEPPLEAPFCSLLDLWKDGLYICSYSNIYKGRHKVFSFNPATKEIIRDGLEIKGTWDQFGAHTFVQTQALLSLEAAE